MANQSYNLAEVVGRCNAFFVTHVMPPVLKNSADLIIIDDFGGGSGMGSIMYFYLAGDEYGASQEKQRQLGWQGRPASYRARRSTA
jgi:hypothetical protein